MKYARGRKIDNRKKCFICKKYHIKGSEISKNHKVMENAFFDILGELIKKPEFMDALCRCRK